MAPIEPTLFSWQDVESSSDIVRLRCTLESLDDAKLIEALTAQRKGRRDDYPIVPLWHSLFAAFIFNLPGPAALIRELKRNAELRQVCGFDPVLGDQAVPPDYVYSRFLAKLVRYQSALEDIFHAAVERLFEVLPGLGRHTAVDSKALPARKAGEAGADTGTKSEKLPDGQVRITFSWFGFKLHLLLDATYELPLAFEITAASEGDSPHLIPLVEQANERHPKIVEQIKDTAGDKGYDDGADKQALFEDYGIIPLIPSRDLARGEMKPLDPDQHDTIYVSPTGEVCCKIRPFDPNPNAAYCKMEYQGFEKDRSALKFRCPAAAYGVECQNQAACRSQTKDQKFGRVLRVPLEENPRLFTPLYQHSQAFKDLYKGRTSIERHFFRLDHFYGFEHPQWGGLAKVTARVTMALTAMLATALAWIAAGREDKIRSMFQAA